MEAANEWLAEYREDYNRRFGKPPREGEDAHRESELESANLDRVQRPHHVRTLTRNLTFLFRNGEYGIQGGGNGYEERR